MKVIYNLTKFNPKFTDGSVITIGNYDGVHLGHQKILHLVKNKAKKMQLLSIVMVFDPSPLEYFTKKLKLKLTPTREKIMLLEKLGIDILLLIKFNNIIANLSADHFVKNILVNILKIRYIVVGDDFTFGNDRKGDFNLLKKMSYIYNFQVQQISSFRIHNFRVSSSLIKKLLDNNLKLAEKMLGRNFCITGIVKHGNHLGRSIGFPTANINIFFDKLLLTGVYLVKIYGISNNFLFGISFISEKHITIKYHYKVCEVHIIDFASNIYGKEITIIFIKKIREEHKFISIFQLKGQIERDLIVAKNIIAQNLY